MERLEALKIVKNCSTKYIELAESFKQDKEIAIQAVGTSAFLIKDVPKVLQNDYDVLEAAAKNNITEVLNLNNNLKSDLRFIKICINCNLQKIDQFDLSGFNEETIESLIQDSKGFAVVLWSQIYTTKDRVKFALHVNPFIFFHLKRDFQFDQDIIDLVSKRIEKLYKYKLPAYNIANIMTCFLWEYFISVKSEKEKSISSKTMVATKIKKEINYSPKWSDFPTIIYHDSLNDDGSLFSARVKTKGTPFIVPLYIYKNALTALNTRTLLKFSSFFDNFSLFFSLFAEGDREKKVENKREKFIHSSSLYQKINDVFTLCSATNDNGSDFKIQINDPANNWSLYYPCAGDDVDCGLYFQKNCNFNSVIYNDIDMSVCRSVHNLPQLFKYAIGDAWECWERLVLSEIFDPRKTAILFKNSIGFAGLGTPPDIFENFHLLFNEKEALPPMVLVEAGRYSNSIETWAIEEPNNQTEFKLKDAAMWFLDKYTLVNKPENNFIVTQLNIESCEFSQDDFDPYLVYVNKTLCSNKE